MAVACAVIIAAAVGGSMVMRNVRAAPFSTTVHEVVMGPLKARGGAGAAARSPEPTPEKENAAHCAAFLFVPEDQRLLASNSYGSQIGRMNAWNGRPGASSR